MIDFAIVGGGIAGVSAAARLAPLGSVVVLEAEHALAYHASGRSAAAFVESYGNAIVRALNEASAPHLRSVEGGVLTPRGMMMLARAGEEEAFEQESREMGLTKIPVEAAIARVPILNPAICKRAAGRDDIFDLDTDRVIQDFLRIARSAGAEVRTRAPVTAIARNRTGWVLDTPAGPVEARILVNAAGAWADQLAEMAGVAPVGLTPFRRSMARIPAPGGHDVSGWPFLDGVGETWYAKPDAGALLVSPAEEHPVAPHDAYADDMVLAEGIARYEGFVTEPVTRMLANWAGLRTFAPDRALVVGRDPADPAFVWIAGQGGYGFQTCAAVSQLVAELMGGNAADLPAPVIAALDPARFS